MSKYTDFFAAASTGLYPHTGSAAISGSHHVTGSVDFAYGVADGTVGGAWGTGGNLATPRYALAGAGTQTAGLAFGGANPGATNSTEEYNGVTNSWSPGGSNMTTPKRILAGAGTQTAALAFGGRTPSISNATEEYNGTWSAGGIMSIARYALAGAGTQTAALAFGGVPTGTNATEEYNGTAQTWGTGGTLATPRYFLAGTGTQTAALAFGGTTGLPAASNSTEEYDGGAQTWGTGGNLATPRYFLAGAGTQTSALAFGGNPTTTATEEYSFSTWGTAPANLIIARRGLAGAGTQTSALAFGGQPNSNSTEEWVATAGPSSFVNGFNFSNSTGDTTVKNLVQTSAQRYKTNIQPLDNQIDNIKGLNPVTYDWKTGGKDIGFLADELNETYPELVAKDKFGDVSGINYSKMVSLLVKSVQEQQIQIENINNKIKNIKK